VDRRVKPIVLLALLGFSVLVSVGLFVPSVYSWTPLEGHITLDTTLMLANSPYRVINDVTVDAGVKLTIELGVKVEFADGFSLIVQGSLNATGTETEQIIFTSSRTSPSPGSWNTIRFVGGKTESFKMKYSNITYAVNGITIATSDGYALIEKCEISHNLESGVMLEGRSNALIRENTIKQNTRGIYTDKYAHSGVVIAGNAVYLNTEGGICLYSEFAYSPIYNVSISSNAVSMNGGHGIYLHSAGLFADHSPIYNVAFSFNTVSSSSINGIDLSSGSLYSSPIYNVSFSSNTVSSNGMHGIYLSSVFADSPIYDVTFSSNTVSSNSYHGICVSSPQHFADMFDLTLVNNMITANNQKGVSIMENINSNLTRNSISYNLYGVFYTTSQSNRANYNDIYRNTYGMIVADGATINAEYNYWGGATGPYQSSINPEGTGNSVNGNGVDLDFIPYLSAPNGRINERPVAELTADKTSVAAGQIVTFDASASTDDGRVDKYLLDFGDGKNSNWTTLSVVKHAYASIGTYTANLTVMDDFGVKSSNTATLTITVSEQLSTLTISLTLNPTIIYSEENVSIQAHVTFEASAVSDASVQLVSDKGGTFTTTSGYTNTNGDFTATFKAPTISEQTNVRITATASKSGYNDGSDYEYVTVYPLGTLFLSVTGTAGPSEVPPGATSTITIRVTDGTNAVSDATVVLSSNKGGDLSPTSGKTNANGYFTSTYTAPTATTETIITISANATKTGYISGQGQTQVTVNPSQPQPQSDLALWMYIAVVIIVVFAIGGGIALARRKSPKPKQEPTPPSQS
jgi:parallel beta-helix repeat protein